MATAAEGTGGTSSAQHCPWRARGEGEILSTVRVALHLGSWSRIRRWERLGPGEPSAADQLGKAGLEGGWSSFATGSSLRFAFWIALTPICPNLHASLVLMPLKRQLGVPSLL